MTVGRGSRRALARFAAETAALGRTIDAALAATVPEPSDRASAPVLAATEEGPTLDGGPSTTHCDQSNG